VSPDCPSCGEHLTQACDKPYRERGGTSLCPYWVLVTDYYCATCGWEGECREKEVEP
jgi:predicted RNA-binding Zn-ribbon protein involved in translation (DUF1610 family)